MGVIPKTRELVGNEGWGGGQREKVWGGGGRSTGLATGLFQKRQGLEKLRSEIIT